MTITFTSPVVLSVRVAKPYVRRQFGEYYVSGSNPDGPEGAYMKLPSSSTPVELSDNGSFPSLAPTGTAGRMYTVWEMPDPEGTEEGFHPAIYGGPADTGIEFPTRISGSVDHAEHPQIDVDADFAILHTVFQSTLAEEIYYTNGFDSSFAPVEWITPELIGLGTNPDIATDADGGVHVVYSATSPDYGIRYRFRDIYGVWGPEQVVSIDSKSREPSIAVTPGKIGIIWNKWETGQLAFVSTERANWVIEEFMVYELESRWGRIASVRDDFYIVSQHRPYEYEGATDWFIEVWQLQPGTDWVRLTSISSDSEPNQNPDIDASYNAMDDITEVSIVWSNQFDLMYALGSDMLIESLAARQTSEPPPAAPTWDERGIMQDPNAAPALDIPVEQENPKGE